MDKTESAGISAASSPAARVLSPEELKLGDIVRIPGIGLQGELLSLPDKKGEVDILCGSMRTKAKAKGLEFIRHAKKPEPGGTKTLAPAGRTMTISPEINLIGKTTDEALYELDKYLDDAYLARLSNVRIVHGKGSGILRDAVRRKLKKVSYVESFRAGEFGEGDAGVTIAVFKS